MKKYIFLGITLMLMMSFLTGCGASKAKISEAQSKYQELIATHNQVAEAYALIEEDTLGPELQAMSDRINELKEYNLYELTNEEIDALIETMDSINNSYSDYLKTIGEIKVDEDNASLTPYSFTLVNDTNIIFSGLTIMESGEKDLVTDVLKDTEGLTAGGSLSGLTVHRDVDETPWLLTLSVADEEDNPSDEYQLILDKDMLSEDGVTLYIKWNEEDSAVYLSK